MITTKATIHTSCTLRSVTLTFLQITSASLLLGLCAQVKIPLFFTPVPLSLQTLGVLLTGIFLGSRKGALSILLYLVWGALGVPLFASGPASFANLIGPNGGYLLGFTVQAYLAGWMAERMAAPAMFKAFAALLFCCFVQMSMGVAWLSYFVGIENVWAMGAAPFIPGEVLKSMIAASIFIASRRHAIT